MEAASPWLPRPPSPSPAASGGGLTFCDISMNEAGWIQGDCGNRRMRTQAQHLQKLQIFQEKLEIQIFYIKSDF